MSGVLAKVIGILFTSIVAPIVVHYAVHGLNGEKPEATPLTAAVELDEVACEGIGASREEARREALRNGLLRNCVSIVTAETWRQSARVITEAVMRDNSDFILRCEDLGCQREWYQGRAVFRSHLSLEVAHRALVDRLRAVNIPVNDGCAKESVPVHPLSRHRAAGISGRSSTSVLLSLLDRL